VLYRPSNGFFDIDSIGAGNYMISLSPDSRFKQQAVECMQNRPVYDPANPVLGAFDFKVHSVKYYLSLTRQDTPLTGVQQLYLKEMQLHNKPISSGDNSLDFTVSASTKAVAFFIQNSKTSSDIRFPPSKFKALGDTDMNLQSFQIQYANRSRPSQKWSSEYKNSDGTVGIQTITQRYYDTFSESGFADNIAGVEGLQEYISRGPIYLYTFERASDDHSTQLQLNLTMGNVAKDTNVVMCSFFNRTVDISYSNGMITNISSLNV
jgi:hypothetical protein